MSYLAQGASVGVRHPVRGDREAFFELRRASEAFHRPWEPASAVEDPYTEQAWDLFLAGHGAAARRMRYLLFRRADDALVGLVNVSEIVRGCFLSAYLGYWIGAPFARQGFMREGLGLVVRHCFDELGLHRLEANIRPENVASLALVRALGFRREGLSPRYLQIDGAWRDHERWAILADD
ncbi:MAG: GNAT family N-acetyltransferase [Planctomycetes bacterium]|nr:GNAT family N-acetyltransferase [Planctomycetota bacterium]